MGPVQRQEYLYYTSQVCVLSPRTYVNTNILRFDLRIQIGKQNALYSNGFSIQNMPVSYVAY